MRRNHKSASWYTTGSVLKTTGCATFLSTKTHFSYEISASNPNVTRTLSAMLSNLVKSMTIYNQIQDSLILFQAGLISFLWKICFIWSWTNFLNLPRNYKWMHNFKYLPSLFSKAESHLALVFSTKLIYLSARKKYLCFISFKYGILKTPCHITVVTTNVITLC